MSENLPNAVQELFLKEVEKLKLRFPVAAISKLTGYKAPIVSEYLSSKKTVSEKFLQTFCEVYDIDYKKLIAGAKEDKPTKKQIPMIGDALAGTDMEMNVKDSNYIEQYIDVGDLLRDSEAAFTVYGNSMTPAYPSGCIVGIKRNYDKFIQPGETYMIVTKSNRVFKRLYYSDDKAGYTCFSDNTLKHETGPMEGKYFYPPFDVSGDDVIAIYDIMGMIKRNRNSGVMHRQG